MQRKWQVISPKVIVEKKDGFGRRLFIVFIIFVALICLFIVGYSTGRHELVPLRHANLDFRQQVLALTEEIKDLVDRNANLEREISALKLNRQIDLDALRVAQEDHKQLQEANLQLEKDLSALKRLVRKGRGGYLKIQNFSLNQGESPNSISYNFTITQMIKEFSESAGDVIIKISGIKDDKHVTFKLDELSGSNPLSHKMRFKHFQNVNGSLRLPEGMVPEALEVEIIPSTKSLMPLIEKFNWHIVN